MMEVSDKAAAILMASGFSRRFGGRNKLLIPFNGKPLASYTLELATAMDFNGGIFFICARDDVAALALEPTVIRNTAPELKVIKNTAPEKGLCESVRLGVEAAGDADYFLFFPCDMPFLDTNTVHGILDARKNGRIVEPRCQGRPGNPCLFSATFREELLSLKEGETPRLIKERHPDAVIGFEVSNPLIFEDIDDEKTLKRLCERS